MRRMIIDPAIIALAALGSRRVSKPKAEPKQFPKPFAVGDVVSTDADLSGTTSRGSIRNVKEGEQGSVTGYDVLGRVQVKFKVSGCDVLVNARPGLFQKVK